MDISVVPGLAGEGVMFAVGVRQGHIVYCFLKYGQENIACKVPNDQWIAIAPHVHCS
jgi:hypothetical protein